MSTHDLTPAVRNYFERHAVDLDLAHELGVRSDRDAIVYPYTTPLGKSFIRRRDLVSKITKQPKGEPLILWWPRGRPDPGVDVLLCEGEPDALAALSALDGDALAVAALPGTAIPLERVTAELAAPKTVYLALDGDDAGRKAANRLARALQSFTCLKVVELGEGEDLASHLLDQADRTGWLREALEQARDAPKLKPKAERQGYARTKKADQLRELRARGIDPDKLDLGDLLDGTRAYIKRFVSLSDAQEVAISLWVAHTHAFAAARRTPYLIATSPREECGKTLLIVEVLAVLVARPWAIEGPPTEAVLFRKIDQDSPTVLFDESEGIFSSRGDRYERMQAIIRASNRRGATVPRCLNRGEGLRDYNTFSPKAFAAIKADDWPRTQLSRSILIHMQRIRADEPIEDFYSDVEEEPDGEGRRLHDSLAAWAREEKIEALRAARPERLTELGRRAFEGWVPLLNIADMAGATWGKRARDAARALSVQRTEDSDTDIELALFAAIRDVFEAEAADRMWTGPLLERLNESDEAPWHNWNDGSGIRPRELANKLRPYGIQSKAVRVGEKVRKGYLLEDFEEAFSRYLPTDDSKRYVGYIGSGKPDKAPSPSVTSAECNPCETPKKPHGKADVTDVTHTSANKGGNGEVWDFTRPRDERDTAEAEVAGIAFAQSLVDAGAAEWVDADPKPDEHRQLTLAEYVDRYRQRKS